MNKYLSMKTLKVNGLNDPIKRHMVAEWVRKHGPHKYYLQKIYFKTKDLHRLKVKVQLRFSCPSKWTGKKSWVAILIPDQIDFKAKAFIKGDTERYYILLKARIHQEGINIVNIYAPNIRPPKYIRKILEGLRKLQRVPHLH